MVGADRPAVLLAPDCPFVGIAPVGLASRGRRRWLRGAPSGADGHTSPVLYRDYLRLEGLCSIVLGAVMALVGAPGVLVDHGPVWPALLLVPGLLGALALAALAGRRASPLRPGEWLTARPLATATEGRPALPEGRVRRRLVVETAAWILGVTGWLVLTGSSAGLIFGTGLASIAFGLVQGVAARRRVAAVEARSGVRYLVAERPGIGTPRLGVQRVDAAPSAPGASRARGHGRAR